MTTEKFVRRSQIIAEHLSEIAMHSNQDELDGVQQPLSPHFREVVSAQERLLNAVERLLEKLPSRIVR
ncbi:MAG: hypothetical protein JWR07_95 [Nevskia sp.]|nr:hypothetical protein [Nevskia sp.]